MTAKIHDCYLLDRCILWNFIRQYLEFSDLVLFVKLTPEEFGIILLEKINDEELYTHIHNPINFIMILIKSIRYLIFYLVNLSDFMVNEILN